MSVTILYLIGALTAGFCISRIFLGFLASKLEGKNYSLKFDAWLYTLLLIVAGWGLIYFFLPDQHDQISHISPLQLVFVSCLALLLYICYLFENELLLNIAILLAAIVLQILTPLDHVPLGEDFPWWANRLAALALIFICTRGPLILNGLNGIFPLYAITIGLGMSIIAYLGGIPVLLGYLAVYFAGIFGGFFNLNLYTTKISLNKGACISASFLLSWFLTQGTVELAGPSMLILTAYFFAELLRALVRHFLIQEKNNDLSTDTVYSRIYQEGLTLPALWVAISKIGLVNIILAGFQLYSPNALSLPFFSLLINLWLLNSLLHAFDAPETLKDAHQQLVDGIKEGIKDIFNNRGNSQ